MHQKAIKIGSGLAQRTVDMASAKVWRSQRRDAARPIEGLSREIGGRSTPTISEIGLQGFSVIGQVKKAT
jgi:hypothetical protein